MIGILEAKALVGKTCELEWKDRLGNVHRATSLIYDATFVPLYGGYLMTAQEDIRLDRLISVRVVEAEPTGASSTASSSINTQNAAA
ncbi:hypothetical protein [Chthonomonas calidirosea]|uniref:hypothetical protein n=1 Tax=Chthonomonas calidirosea TaxID=454171 RepID=UPI0006ECC493|nr:hypothetical protein [Chthonomonas calidirosea]CEK18022.1 hypothetical protein CP488_02042 [Chthonomonas calidirosea]